MGWPVMAGWYPEGEGLLKISGCTRPSLWNELDHSICEYSSKSLSVDELKDHLFKEVGRTSYDTRRRVRNTPTGVNAPWSVGNTVPLGARQGERNVGGNGFFVSRE